MRGFVLLDVIVALVICLIITYCSVAAMGDITVRYRRALCRYDMVSCMRNVIEQIRYNHSQLPLVIENDSYRIMSVPCNPFDDSVTRSIRFYRVTVENNEGIIDPISCIVTIFSGDGS